MFVPLSVRESGKKSISALCSPFDLVFCNGGLSRSLDYHESPHQKRSRWLRSNDHPKRDSEICVLGHLSGILHRKLVVHVVSPVCNVAGIICDRNSRSRWKKWQPQVR